MIEFPMAAPQFRRRIKYYALAFSVVVHAAMLVQLGARVHRAGQSGSDYFIAARLVDTRVSAMIFPQLASHQSPATSDSRVMLADQSSNGVHVPANPVDEPNRRITRDKPVAQPPVQNGKRHASIGDPDYQSIVLAYIDARKRYPYRAWRRHIEGTVDISMLVNNDGTATILAAVSDTPAFIEAATEAIYRAQPLPLPADAVDANPVKIDFTMEFIIRDRFR